MFAAEKEGKNSGGAKNNGGAQANSNRIAVARTDSATGRAYLSYVDPAHLHASADEDFAGFVEHGLPSINTDVDILDEDEDESMASESATSAISEKLSRFRKSPSKSKCSFATFLYQELGVTQCM